MSNTIQQSFGINLRTMRLFGLYPPDSYKKLYRTCTHIMYIFLIVPVPVLQCLNLFLREDLTFKEIADNTYLIAELGCFIPKFWPFLNNGERIKKCILYFNSPVFQVVRKEHEEIMKDCVKFCRATTIFFFTSVTAAYLSWASRPIAWKGHIFPTELWLPFDPKTAPWIYNCCVYVYILLAVMYGAYSSVVVDPLVGGLAYQATAQLKILKHNLEFLGEDVNEMLEKNPKKDILQKAQITYEKVRQCIIHHNRILQFIKEYEKCFSQVAFSQFASGVVVFCVSCLQLTIVEIASFNFLAMMMYLIATVNETYLYCHFGTILFEENKSLNDAIYLSNWYEFDIKSRKALIILMERAKRPMTVTCGKIFDMSLVTFTMILRRSYSLLAVLENYNINLG